MQLRLWGSQLRLKLAQIGLSTKKKHDKKESPQSLVPNTTLGDVASLAAVSLSRASCQPSKLYMINVANILVHLMIRGSQCWLIISELEEFSSFIDQSEIMR